MRATASILVAVLVMTTTAAAEPGVLDDIYKWLYPPKASPTVPIPVPAPQKAVKPETKPTTVPESPRAPSVKPKLSPPKQADRPRKAPPPPADVCSKISWGLTIVSRERVVAEGMKRGYSKATVEKTIRDCGY